MQAQLEAKDIHSQDHSGQKDVSGRGHQHYSQSALLGPAHKGQKPRERRQRQDRMHGHGVGRFQCPAGCVRCLWISSEHEHHALGDHQRP